MPPGVITIPASRRIYSSVRYRVLGLVVLLSGICLLSGSDASEGSPTPSLQDNTEVTVLLWTHPFGTWRKLPDCWEQYRISGCKITDNTGSYQEADAVIFHHRDIAGGGLSALPSQPRPPTQKWIWMNQESPTHSSRMQVFEGVFNLTLSYREDSDIFIPYGYLIPRALTDKVIQGRYALPLSVTSASDPARPHFVAWVVSNWSENHARVIFYRLLIQHVQVDLFGAWGRPLPSGSQGVMELLRGYLFYLAMENSQHTDYITEKLWNAVSAGAIPVVLGPSRVNYERFLPPEAFIHVDDFPTVQELAQYLLMLKDNPAMAHRHLAWRKHYSLYRASFWNDQYCTACSAVRKTRGRRDVVQHLSQWYWS